ncbi:MAG: hypothetical protein IT454_13275 [Planctomycetes bacterium]|nr:hypothetical protein [Planctomycetota bacterium]
MWRPVRTADGSWTLEHSGHGQACHSHSGAWLQARARYAEPCRLQHLARERGVVRVLDIGTGLGLNLAAAARAAAQGGGRMQAVTLERDSRVLQAAFELPDWPADIAEHLAPIHAALREQLAHSSSSATLDLRLGDARERLTELSLEPFDAVFLDPFSPQVEPELWSEAFLAAVARRMAPHAVLSTYSASLGVRTTLARVGLAVGLGPRVGTKASGTLASFETSLPELEPRVARKLARRLERTN